jgi:DTW domain-containing protein YfiP
LACRTRSKNRCPKCHMRSSLCVCGDAPYFNLKTKIIILLHARESYRPTNTGRLLTLALPHSEVRIRGKKGSVMSSRGLVDDNFETLFFYPSEKATELSSDFIKTIGKPITLIVPDGSWRQAGKVMNRESVLKNIRHVKLPIGPTPALRLRKESKVNGLSTFEAVARALGVIENIQVQASLESFYQIIAERTLWSRAKLLLKDCETKIPDIAQLESKGNDL